MSRFVLSARNVLADGSFGTEPAQKLTYLEVPKGEKPNAMRHQLAVADWIKRVCKHARRRQDQHGFWHGDILVFVHGYSTDHTTTLKRHDLLLGHLDAIGFYGSVVTFDWPSMADAMAYLEDRWSVIQTAHALVIGGILPLKEMVANRAETKCDLDIHLIGHSSGAYVIREAFYQASKHRKVAQSDWGVGQIVLFGGDLGVESMRGNDKKSRTLYERAARITNYVNPHDIVLRLSNSKRLFTAPRIGRVGLPDDAPNVAYDVHIGPYFKTVNPDINRAPGGYWHSFHFDDRTVIRDLFELIKGHDNRSAITGRVVEDGRIYLRYGPRTVSGDF